jgi:hypothetical protein
LGGVWDGTKSPYFFKEVLKLQNLDYSSSMSPKYKGVPIFFYFPLSPHLICSQIWQSPLVDDQQSTHLKKIEKQKNHDKNQHFFFGKFSPLGNATISSTTCAKDFNEKKHQSHQILREIIILKILNHHI